MELASQIKTGQGKERETWIIKQRKCKKKTKTKNEASGGVTRKTSS